MLFAAILVTIASMLAAFGGTAALAGKNPPGNNGTIKVNDKDFPGGQRNEPHVGCVFQINFYGYDEGDLNATYAFDLQAPTKGDIIRSGSTFIGEDPAGGGTDHDAKVVVDLTQPIADSGVAAQPQQGWHVKLTIHAEGSQGADVKHKVFWVECALPGGSTPPPGGPPPGGSTPPPSVLPTTVHKKPQVLAKQLARTGSGQLGTISVAGIGFLAIGFFLIWFGREKAEQLALAAVTVRPGNLGWRKRNAVPRQRARTDVPPRGPP
jgi:hypothetical protein